MIKQILFLAVLVSNSAFAQIQFENSLHTTFEKAKKENKAVFIEYFSRGCPHCQKIAPILETQEVGNAYNPVFVSYKIDTYDGLTPEEEAFLTKHKLFFTDVPNFVYFDKDENFLHHTSGVANSEYIIAKTKEVFDPKIQTSNLAKRVKDGDKSLNTLFQYSQLAQLNQNKPLADSIANQLYKSINKSNLASETSYVILKNAVFTTQNGFFEFWVANLNQLKNMDSGQLKGQEVEVLKNIISIDLSDANFKWDAEAINKMHSYILATEYTKKPETVLVDKRVLFFNSKNIGKEISTYFSPIANSSTYGIDDKIYILQVLDTHFKDKKAQKIIRQFAKDLNKQAEKETNAEAIKQLNKIIMSAE